MIRKLLLFGSLIFLIAAFIPKKLAYRSVNEGRKKEFLPPGTVKINDTLYADETEVSNFSWLEYQFWIFTKYGYYSDEYKAVLPDTLVWRDKAAYNEPYVEYYLRHPAYRNYPVVGISYEQAIEYCKWRTERVQEFMCISKKYDLIDFEYRLPTKQEWEFLSNNGNYGDGYNVFSNRGKDEKGRMTSNRRLPKGDTLGWNGIIQDNADVTAPVYSYCII